MLKWSLSVPLGSLTVWACSFPNIAKFQFLHQADRDNHTVKNLHSWLSEMTFPFLPIRKATTLASQWLISRNLGGSIAKKKSRPMLAASTGPILSPWVSERVEQLFQTVPMRQDDWEHIQNSRSPLSYWTMPLYSGGWSTVGMCQNGRHHSKQKCSENPGNYLWRKKPGRWCHRPSYTTRGLAVAQS